MITDEWTEGYDAYSANKPKTANPYRPSTDEYLEWQAGWNAHHQHKRGE